MIHLAIFKEIKYNCLTKMLSINDAGNSIRKKQIHYLEFRYKSRRYQSSNNVLNKYRRIGVIKGLCTDKDVILVTISNK